MDKKTKKLLLIGGVAVGGFLLYQKFGPGSSSSIDPQVMASVQGWAQQQGSAGVHAMVTAAVPNEINFLYHVIQTYFNTGQNLPASDAQVWQALQQKYNFG